MYKLYATNNGIDWYGYQSVSVTYLLELGKGYAFYRLIEPAS